MNRYGGSNGWYSDKPFVFSYPALSIREEYNKVFVIYTLILF